MRVVAAALALGTGAALAGTLALAADPPPARAPLPPVVVERVPDPGARPAAAPVVDKVLRGRYLVESVGCGDCHTPWKMGRKGPEPDASRLLSGHPQSLPMPPAPKLAPGPWTVVSNVTNTSWSGPWGTTFSANLTPDNETGLGLWSLQQFKDTLRLGKHAGIGRPVLPPMPISAYRHLNDADLEAMFAYLQAVPAIRNRVPENLPPTKP